MGRVELEPDKETVVPLRFNGTGTYTPGQWQAVYDSESEELSVHIVLERFYAEMEGGTIETAATDMFSGYVEKDGGLWFADWITMPEVSVTTDEKGTVSLPAEAESQPQSVVFEKVE